MSSNAMPTAQLAAMLSGQVGGFTTPKIILFTNNVTVTNDTVIGDLIEPTGDWYTAQDAVFGDVYETANESVTCTAASVQFDYTGTDPSEDIYGFAVTDGSTNLYMCGNLPSPVTMGSTLDAVIVQPSITVPAISQS